MSDKSLIHNTTKNALAQGAGAVVSKGFAALMTTIGVPEAAILTPLVRGATIGVMNTCYDDIIHRSLSRIESSKVDLVSQTALQTFIELAEKDGVTAMNMQIEDGQLQYAYEVSEGLILTAIRQSQKKVVEVLGRYYGRSFYKGDVDWQDMHQMINMVGNLSLRQIVLIKLISEGFKDIDGKLFISNPSACVEVNRLKDYGIWQTEGASFGINDSWAIQLNSIISTIYSDKVCEVLMLDRLSEDDIKRTIDSLQLTSEGTPQTMLTEEDYKAHTTWQVDGEKLILPDGKTYGGNPDEDMFLYDMARGK